MAGFTIICCRNVPAWLGMTTGAGTQHLGMINGNCRTPGKGIMTGLADIGAADMAGRLVVAAGTGAQHLTMIHRDDRCPVKRRMTGFTDIR